MCLYKLHETIKTCFWKLNSLVYMNIQQFIIFDNTSLSIYFVEKVYYSSRWLISLLFCHIWVTVWWIDWPSLTRRTLDVKIKINQVYNLYINKKLHRKSYEKKNGKNVRKFYPIEYNICLFIFNSFKPPNIGKNLYTLQVMIS